MYAESNHRTMKPRFFFCLLLFQGFWAGLQAQTAHQYLRQGDESYDLSHYDEAEKQYRSAVETSKNKSNADYNLANSLYQQGKWEEAAAQYELAKQSTMHSGHLSDTHYNLGNALLQQHKYKEAVGEYERSLRLQPGRPDAKANHQLAKKKLREQQAQERQKQQQQEQEKNKQQQQDQAQQTPPKEQQPPQPNQSPSKSNQPPQPNDAQPSQQPQPAEQPGKMGQGDARKLLDAVIKPEDQKNARKYRAAQRQDKPKSGKDW
jgi:Ca-activated chloride channel homolog